MISRCWRHWSNILEMEVRGRLHLWLGIEEWVVGQNVAARCGASGVLGALEHECGVCKRRRWRREKLSPACSWYRMLKVGGRRDRKEKHMCQKTWKTIEEVRQILWQEGRRSFPSAAEGPQPLVIASTFFLPSTFSTLVFSLLA